MIPATFEYHRAASVQEALNLMGQYGEDAKLLAGGHSLIPIMKLRFARYAHLIDISRLEKLKTIRNEGQTIVIGAMTTHRMIETSGLIKAKIPVLSEAARQIGGGVQIRNMGTIGGNLSHADPVADFPPAILVTEAELVLQSLSQKRTVKAEDFFFGMFTTAIQPDEMLVEIRVNLPEEPTGSCYLKFAHPASGFAVVGCAASVTLNDGICKAAKVAFSGISAKPFRDSAIEEELNGNYLDEATIVSTSQKAAEGVELFSDRFASEDYRRHLAKVYAKRALLRAVANIR